MKFYSFYYFGSTDFFTLSNMFESYFKRYGHQRSPSMEFKQLTKKDAKVKLFAWSFSFPI